MNRWPYFDESLHPSSHKYPFSQTCRVYFLGDYNVPTNLTQFDDSMKIFCRAPVLVSGQKEIELLGWKELGMGQEPGLEPGPELELGFELELELKVLVHF